MSAEETAIATTDAQTLAVLNERLSLIPGVDEDPTERMLALVDQVSSPEEWNAIWDKLPAIKELENVRVRINDVRLRPSDFEGSDYYLLMDVTELGSGERRIISSSSTMCNLQAAKAYIEGWLPLDVEIRGPRKETKNGFRPLHLHALSPDELKAKAGARG